MRVSFLVSCVCASVLLLNVVSVSGFWVFNSAPLVTERLDPVVTPGAVSPHMHTVHGGSNFAATYTYDDLYASECTTIPMTRDKSNYWVTSESEGVRE